MLVGRRVVGPGAKVRGQHHGIVKSLLGGYGGDGVVEIGIGIASVAVDHDRGPRDGIVAREREAPVVGNPLARAEPELVAAGSWIACTVGHLPRRGWQRQAPTRWRSIALITAEALRSRFSSGSRVQPPLPWPDLGAPRKPSSGGAGSAPNRQTSSKPFDLSSESRPSECGRSTRLQPVEPQVTGSLTANFPNAKRSCPPGYRIRAYYAVGVRAIIGS